MTTKRRTHTTFLGTRCKLAPRTNAHRPAIWECMLGTVYAMNDARVTKYFDYDHAAAIAYAGVTSERDPRLHKVRQQDNYRWHNEHNGEQILGSPRVGKLVLWITK